MKQNSWEEPRSFAETVQLVENYVRQEITRETKDKQLYYHTLDHALAVKRRANTIFQAIESFIPKNQLPIELERLECLLGLCAIAHDLVQQFSVPTEIQMPRKRTPGVSETATVAKLIKYIQQLNQRLLKRGLDASILFNDRDLVIIEEAILATICDRDPQAGKASYSFSPYSIYQPYLYNSESKISIVGNIIALADLGTLGMDGVEQYLKEGILIFLEDNLDLKDLILNCDRPAFSATETVKTRLLNMARFMVNLARERQARLELEIADFSPQARQILRSQIFVYLNRKNIEKIIATVPTDEHTSLAELIDFFCLNKNT